MNQYYKQLITLAAEELKEISKEFNDELRRRPTSRELFEILTWAIKVCDEETLSEIHPADIIALKPQLKSRADNSVSFVPSPSAAVSELNDAVFVSATEMFVRLAQSIKSEIKRAPTLSEICALLVEGINQCDEHLLYDIHPKQIRGIKPEINKKKRKVARIGDIVAVPAKNGEYFILVVLAKNAFGTAFGVFKGTGKLKLVSNSLRSATALRPVYSAEDLIESGRWKVIGHDESLLNLFPTEPEIYHYQHADKPNPLIGSYGSGETASGKLRPLSKEEASGIGLLSGEYRQSYMPETLENYLNSMLR